VDDVVVHVVMMAAGILTTPMCHPTLKPEMAAMSAHVVEYNVNPIWKLLECGIYVTYY
jgi:hypothetical protein